MVWTLLLISQFVAATLFIVSFILIKKSNLGKIFLFLGLASLLMAFRRITGYIYTTKVEQAAEDIPLLLVIDSLFLPQAISLLMLAASIGTLKVALINKELYKKLKAEEK